MSDPQTSGRADQTGSAASANPGERAAETDFLPSPLRPEEIERIEDYEELEDFIEETPEGSLSIISDEDIPGAPG